MELIQEKKALKQQNDDLRLQLADLPIWVGTEALQTLDTTAHTLTPTTLTQIVEHENDTDWRTAFTRPINEGEWELKIRASEITFDNVMIGFLEHPLPEDATQSYCGSYHDGIGGHFTLWSGELWRDGEFKPEGTNRTCESIGQTAAIRVNMSTREARLFVDDEEQPGIFTDIPSPICLGITTGDQNVPIEVLWLKRLRGNDELERAVNDEKRTLKSENDELTQKLADLPIWVGTESLQTLNRTVHTLTPTTLTQIIATPKDKPFRTAFTLPIDQGEWELKIRANESTFWGVMLGFLRHPLPEKATETGCGYWTGEIGGTFNLPRQTSAPQHSEYPEMILGAGLIKCENRKPIIRFICSRNPNGELRVHRLVYPIMGPLRKQKKTLWARNP
ncbi:hypothetical protein BLNAU_24666 [Blattamonas nauphoetae]|uniref:Uncharacterized protein n=1 Tax=Blattamonas nauphoetae TaxID=2049346 RepID=A0ABQ9WLU7_9EUKA|nr:hypothetical protein BLNAU_24666 [Blattamonas nauphoetae]